MKSLFTVWIYLIAVNLALLLPAAWARLTGRKWKLIVNWRALLLGVFIDQAEHGMFIFLVPGLGFWFDLHPMKQPDVLLTFKHLNRKLSSEGVAFTEYARAGKPLVRLMGPESLAHRGHVVRALRAVYPELNQQQAEEAWELRKAA